MTRSSSPSGSYKDPRRSLSGWLWSLRYLFREGKCLPRIMARAKRQEAAGDDGAMRRTLEMAAAISKSIQRDEKTFSRSWKYVVEHQLAIYDLSAAGETSRRAAALNLPAAHEARALVELMIEETAPWSHLVNAARLHLCYGEEMEHSAGSLIVFLPSSAFVFDKPGEPGMRAGLRFIFGEIIDTCRELGIPFEVRGRLANHGTPKVEDGRRYVSHHSIADNENGLHIKATDRPRCFSFDTRGYSGWSKFGSTPWDELRKLAVPAEISRSFVEEKQRIIGGNVSKYTQTSPGPDPDTLPEKYVFLGLQKHDDSVQQLARIPMLAMLEEVARACRARNIPLIVKRHPKCQAGVVSRALAQGTAEGMFRTSDASIHALIAGSCAVCVVNSSVGAEALLHEKPVYVFGASEYQQVCYRMYVPGDFDRTFRPDEMAVSREDLQVFLHLLRHHYAVDVTDTAKAKNFIRERILQHVKTA